MMRERVRVLLMGCICSKRAIHLRRGQRRGAGGRASGIHHRQISKSNNEHASRRNTSGGDPANGNGGASDGRAESELTIDGSNSPNITSDSSGLYEAMFAGLQIAPAIPNALEIEQIAAGWPSWLTSVASEAIRGMLPRKGTEFEILEKVRTYDLKLTNLYIEIDGEDSKRSLIFFSSGRAWNVQYRNQSAR